MSIIEVNHIEMMIGACLLFKVDQLRIEKQDRIGIVGRNGVGKSTLLSILTKQLVPDAGTVETNVEIELIPQFKAQHLQKSGGEITEMYIKKALAKTPALLMADEPTMNLDVEKIAHLERELLQFNGAFVVVSHDRTFLNHVCTKIWEIDNQTVREFKGNYNVYLKQKELEKRHHEAQYKGYVKKKKALKQAIEGKERKAQKMTRAPSRMSSNESKLHKVKKGKAQKGVHQSKRALETRMNQLQQFDKPKVLPQVKISIPNATVIQNQTVIRADKLEAKVRNNLLWKNVSFEVRSGDKVALIGLNGTGKTTLLRHIIECHTGVQISSAVKIGYFSQNLDILDLNQTMLENVKETSIHDETLIRTVLARLLFKNEDVYKKVSVLSGGERVKVAFAKVFLSDMNVLIMDEPTNFLDIPSIEAFEQLLLSYEGTVLFVSHDRSFVQSTATKIIELFNSTVVSFDGNYDEYEQRKNKAKVKRNDVEEELMLIETKLSAVISKLSEPVSIEQKKQLEEQFQQLIEKRRVLKEN
ncbi:ribosomal protection-like ABC-F family protein [Bacillus solimangrovi]|uniref:ABC transporter domain-containing protein n=1 Tax=Bacillus solimangrovi TaxID=1305675 RepID=A0A1E5LHR6_9BACI|nr:ABC-F type ribosomal protection protein [Bacillus solimangrovi]OEH93615.1 hypothetical protein BFG57_01115 [Bacillus solimangrovi]